MTNVKDVKIDYALEKMDKLYLDMINGVNPGYSKSEFLNWAFSIARDRYDAMHKTEEAVENIEKTSNVTVETKTVEEKKINTDSSNKWIKNQ